MKILIGTNNKAKVLKYGTMLSDMGIEYCTPKDINLDLEVNETGNTTEENSKIKAKAYYEATKMPVIVDDSGLIIDKFSPEDQPGVFVRRYKGNKLSDEELIQIYSQKIANVGGETEGAFIIAISIVDAEGAIHTHVTKHERYFISKPCEARTEGYPMNSLIYDKEAKKYLAEIYKGSNIYSKTSGKIEYSFIKETLLK